MKGNVANLKNMKKFFILLSLLITFACSENEKKSKKADNEVLLTVGKEAEKTQFFKEYFELDNVIPIETTDEFLIGNSIKRVVAYKDKLVILDDKSAILVVDYATGKVDTYFKKIGQGPGESIKVLDICIDDKTETIIAFNDSQYLLFFDFKGNFIKQEKFEKLYDCLIYDDGNILFYNSGEAYSCYPYMIEKYNIKEKTLKIIGSEDKLDAPVRLYGRHIVKSENIWFGTPYDFDLYLYADSKIKKRYILNPAVNHMPKEDMMIVTTDRKRFSELRSTHMYGIGAIRETEHYLLFISSKTGFFILNKETNEIRWEINVDETSLGLKLYNYFSHDGDDNRIMFIIQPDEWLRGKKEAKMEDIPAALKQKIDSFIIDEESNPILVFYREK